MGLANYWGQGGGVVQRVGVICHFPQCPKRVSTFSSSLGCSILVLLHTHRGTTQVRSQGCWACFLRLTSCPPSLGTEDAESERGVTVGDKERSIFHPALLYPWFSKHIWLHRPSTRTSGPLHCLFALPGALFAQVSVSTLSPLRPLFKHQHLSEAFKELPKRHHFFPTHSASSLH